MKLTPNRDEIWVTGASGNKVLLRDVLLCECAHAPMRD